MEVSAQKKNKYSNKDLFAAFFEKVQDTEDLYTCKICSQGLEEEKKKKYRYPSGVGYTNPTKHIENQHEQTVDHVMTIHLKKISQTQLPKIFLKANVPPLSDYATAMYAWLEMVVMEDNPFSIVSSSIYRKFTNFRSFSRTTLMKYLELVHENVKGKLSTIIPNNFSIVFDGWTNNNTTDHYFAFFLVWSTNDGYNQCLLSCNVLRRCQSGHIKLNAENVKNEIIQKLHEINKEAIMIDCIIGDNASVNKKVAKLLHVPFIGCASHRLALSVKLITEKLVSNKNAINKVHNLMKSLRSLKNSSILQEFTNLSGITKNETRWCSIHNMLKRYLQIRKLPKINYDAQTLSLFPSAAMDQRIENLNQILSNINEISVVIQTANANLNLAAVRSIFDGKFKYIL